ncbi:MAG: CBS domain-containing protein [Verrucomicrobiota bacterium]|nr:CBS domain-containing protein [Verrucomicrobiota bacterium]
MASVAGTVGQILTQKGKLTLKTISPDQKVYGAIEQMAVNNIGALLVMTGDHLDGIVSERDYTRKVILNGKSSKETPVSDIMTKTVICANPSLSIEECLRKMSENDIRHMPVLDGDKVVGMLSIGDLVRWVISAQDATISQLESYITGQV